MPTFTLRHLVAVPYGDGAAAPYAALPGFVGCDGFV